MSFPIARKLISSITPVPALPSVVVSSCHRDYNGVSCLPASGLQNLACPVFRATTRSEFGLTHCLWQEVLKGSLVSRTLFFLASRIVPNGQFQVKNVRTILPEQRRLDRWTVQDGISHATDLCTIAAALLAAGRFFAAKTSLSTTHQPFCFAIF